MTQEWVLREQPGGVGHGTSAVRSREALFSRFMGKNRSVGIGIYDGLSARLASRFQFDFLWLGSFSMSASMGIPDMGIIDAERVSDVVRSVRLASPLPIVVDLDSGYGDPLKLHHVVQEFVFAGATALCIEDNPAAKRCSLYDSESRTLASVSEHVARIRAARAGVDAAGGRCAIIARTEALVARLGNVEALHRATAYVEAGADAVFVQSLDASGREVLEFGQHWNRRTPVLVTPTRYFGVCREDLFAAGLSHVIYANQAIRAAHAAMGATFDALTRSPSGELVEASITPVGQLAQDVGKDTYEELEVRLTRPAVSVV